MEMLGKLVSKIWSTRSDFFGQFNLIQVSKINLYRS